eukprot:Pgem_evm1s5704
MEIKYFPYGGSMTDYTCKLLGETVGVSVTRAFQFNKNKSYNIEDAERLLNKKLTGCIFATRNCQTNLS